MVRTLPFTLLCLACTVQDVPVEVADVADVAWSGAFVGDGCTDGDVSLALSADVDGALVGTFDYVSVAGSRATYEVLGDVVEGTLVVDQVDLLDQDASAATRWCFGTYTLGLAVGDGWSRLIGDWEPVDCDCGGALLLEDPGLSG